MLLKRRMKFVDLFCGIGGASAGCKSVGMQVALAVDADEEALAVHKLNHPKCKHLCLTLPCSFPLPTGPIHIHASPPCQAVSQANRNVSRARQQNALSLLEWAVEFCQAHGTTWSIEQVASVDVCHVLRAMNVAFDVFHFEDLGVAQTRKRVIAGSPEIVQALRDEAGKHRQLLSVRDVIPHCRGDYIRNGTTNTWKVVGGVKRQIPLTEEHPSFARHVSEPAYTVTGHSPLRWYSPQGCSVFTPHELALLQGFPKTYQLHEKIRLSYKYVGNAFPPPVVSVIVKAARRSVRPTGNKRGGPHQGKTESRGVTLELVQPRV